MSAQRDEKVEYGLKEQIQRACDMVAGDRVVGKSPYTPEQIAEIDAFNKANPLPPVPRPTARQLLQQYATRCNLQDEDVEYVLGLIASEISAAYERCAQLVESSHTAHDLHEIAATIRGWKNAAPMG